MLSISHKAITIDMRVILLLVCNLLFRLGHVLVLGNIQLKSTLLFYLPLLSFFKLHIN